MSFPGGGEGVMPMPRDGEMYCLKWHTYQSHFTSGLRSLFLEGDAAETDVTLAAEGRYIQCHKWLLSLCSPYFKKLFRANVNYRTANTIVIVNNDIKFRDLENLVHFMYNGEVKVATNNELQGFLKGGELLEIEGLTRCTDATEEQKGRRSPPQPQKSSATSSSDDRSGVGVPSAPPPSAASVQPGSSSSSNFKNSYSTGATTTSAHSASKTSQLSAARGPSGMSGIKRARYAEQSASESSMSTNSGTSNIKNTGAGSGSVGYSNRHDREVELGETTSGLLQSDPLAFDPNIDGAGNLDPLGNIGTDPLAVEGESVETDERMMQFEGIKRENSEVYIDEGEEEEVDYDTSDQGENSGMGEGMYQSGGISVETGATVTGLNLPGPSSESNITGGIDTKTQDMFFITKFLTPKLEHETSGIPWFFSKYYQSDIPDLIACYDKKECIRCGSELSTKISMARHYITHLKANFPCRICGIIVSNDSTMSSHLKSRHGICGTGRNWD